MNRNHSLSCQTIIRFSIPPCLSLIFPSSKQAGNPARFVLSVAEYFLVLQVRGKDSSMRLADREMIIAFPGSLAVFYSIGYLTY